MVEIDPLVYRAAVDHFNLTLPASTTVNLLDGNEYVSSLARMRREGTYDGQKWRLVVQDCFSGGGVPEEIFTREFWMDLAVNVEQDGIVAMASQTQLECASIRPVQLTRTELCRRTE
jgi:spermidine synthase